MSKGKRILVQSEGWRIEEIVSWPESAKLWHQGWCTSVDKDSFDNYKEKGNLYVIYKPTNRNCRPSYQCSIPNEYDGSFEMCKSGDYDIDAKDVKRELKDAPAKIFAFISEAVTDQIRKEYEYEENIRLHRKYRLHYIGRDESIFINFHPLTYFHAQSDFIIHPF